MLLIKKETSITKMHKSTIDLILTNKALSFQSTNVTETYSSGHHESKETFVKEFEKWRAIRASVGGVGGMPAWGGRGWRACVGDGVLACVGAVPTWVAC